MVSSRVVWPHRRLLRHVRGSAGPREQQPTHARAPCHHSSGYDAALPQDSPSALAFPFGAWGYHSAQQLIRSTPKKPLRIFTHNSEFDLGWNTSAAAQDDTQAHGGNVNGDHTASDPLLHNWTDHHHNWRVAGNRTAMALASKGYRSARTRLPSIPCRGVAAR